MPMPSTARRAGALLIASLLGGCACLCPRPQSPPPPPGDPEPRRGHAGPGGPWHDPAFAAAMQGCLRELGVDNRGPPGARGAPPDHEALDACLRGKGVQPPPRRPRDPAFDAAVQACKAVLDLKDPDPPPPEARAAMAACLKDKGIAPPTPPEAPPPPAR